MAPSTTKVSENHLKTYRYLRVGMVFVIVLLAVAVVIEIASTQCVETSLSAYYYTPARSVFVGTLIAIAACFVIIRGYNDLEDICLNFAGMLAPIVAFVPIKNPDQTAPLTEAPPGVENNIEALLWVGFAVVLVSAAIVVRSWKDLTEGWGGSRVSRVAGVAGAAVIVGGTYLWYGLNPTSFAGQGKVTAHYVAAITMFAFFVVVVLINARPSAPGRPRGRRLGYIASYSIILALMVLVVIVTVAAAFGGWDYAVLGVEAGLIVLFAVFWAIQGRELESIDENAAAPGRDSRR